MKRKRNQLHYILVLFLVAISHANKSNPRRGPLMSAPLDLLSESLSSTSSLINQLMLKQHRDERGLGGPMAMPRVQTGRFQPFRRRRQTTTTPAPIEVETEEVPLATRETLVYACPEPEGCPPPVRGQKYEPIRISSNANLEKPRDVLDTIYRQEVVKNNKKMLRVRKKQRKPSKSKSKEKLKKEEAVLPLKAVEMVSEMIKEAGPVLTEQEIAIIADVSQEVGAKVNEKQVKVISMLAEAMGPNLSTPEVKTIAEVASTVEEDTNLASDSTLKVVAEMIKSKVGQPMTEPQLEKIVEVMTKEPLNESESKESGLSDHAAEMVAQMMNNIGNDASAAEVQIVAEMIKELDKDVPEETAEVMAQVLQELMPEVTPDLVHNVSAVLANEEANLVKEDVEMVAEVIKQSPPLSTELTPEVIEIVAEMAVEQQMSDRDVVKVVAQETNSIIQESDVETIKEVTEAVMKQNKVLEEADLEVISMMTKVSADEAARPILQPINDNSITGQISDNEAKFLSNVMKLFGTRVTPTEEAELEVEVEKADPTLNENQVEVMTQLLIEMGPEIEPEAIKEMAHMVADPSLDIRADNVKDIAQMVEQMAVTLEAQEVKTISDVMKKVGPDVSMREMHMITRMAGIDQQDVAVMAHVLNELGNEVSDNEAELISMMTKANKESEVGDESVGEQVVEVIQTMGEAITNAEKKVIAEVLVNATNEQVKEEDAEIVAEIIQEVGPEIAENTVEKLTIAVTEANSIDSKEKMKKVMAILEETPKPEPIEAKEVVMVSDLMNRLSMDASGDMSPSEMVQVANIGKQIGMDVSPEAVGSVHDIEQVVETKLTEEDAELVEVVAAVLKEEKSPEKDISLDEASHLTDVMNNLDNPESNQKAKVVMVMVKDMAPALEEEKVEKIAQVVAEVGSNLHPENVTEVVKLLTDDSVADDVTVEAIEHMADMAKKMSAPVTMEQVEIIAEVKAESGQHMSFSEMKLATDLANQIQEENQDDIKIEDVEAVVEMIEMIKAEENADKAEVIAVISMVAGEEVFSSDSSTRLTSGSLPSQNLMSDREAGKIKDMIEEMEDNGSSNDAAEEAVIVDEIMHMERDLNPEEAETAVKILENLEDVEEETVKIVVDMVKDPEIDLKPDEVEAIAEITSELTENILPMDVIVVSNLAARMGPVLTEREKEMISRLATSSGVDVDKKEVEIINEVANEIGNLSDGEAEIVVMLANDGKDKNEVIAPEAAAEVADVVKSMGGFMSSQEVSELKEMIKEKVPKLDEEEVAVMTEVLVQVGPTVDADVVAQAAEVADDTPVTPHAIDVIADMAKKLDSKIEPEKMEVIVDLIEKSGTNISPREMQMIQRMSNKANISLTTNDVKVVEEMVNMLGRDLSTKEVKLMAVLVEQMDKKEENEKAEDLMKTLKAMDGRKLGLGEMQMLENIIEKMEPLMTKGKTQVMSQVLIEADPDKIAMEDVKELAEIVMKASDDITPGEIEEIAQITRTADETLTENEVKVVAEMSSKFGESLSQRELQMIGRMMRNSGVTMTLNDIAMVAEVKKVRSDKENEISDNDAKLIAKMTEIVDATPKDSNVFTTTSKPFARLNMLPKKPTVSTLPDIPRRPPRIKMNMKLQNRPLAKRPLLHRPPPRPYGAPEPPAPVTEEPRKKYQYKLLPPAVNNDGDFGQRDPEDIGLGPRQNFINNEALIPIEDEAPPPIRKLPPPRVLTPELSETVRTSAAPAPLKINSRPLGMGMNPIKPTLDTLKTTMDPLNELEVPEHSTQIRLEEFLMRNRPTPFRQFPSPSEDPPEDGDFNEAVRPTEAITENTNGDLMNLPGDSFMKIVMGQSNFGDKAEKLQLDEDKNQKLQLPSETPKEMAVTRDTLKSVAENFAFTKNEPQGMLMNFLMKKKLPTQPTKPTPPPTLQTTTESPDMGFFSEMITREPLDSMFNMESTTLDKTKSGNFMQMSMGKSKPIGVDPKVLPKLQKNRISLNPDGNSFMSMSMGDLMRRRISERMSTIAAESDNKDIETKRRPRRPVRKIKAPRPLKKSVPRMQPKIDKISDRSDVEERVYVDQTPFTARPTLPVGQATLWPMDTPASNTLKPFVFLGVSTTPTPFTVRPTRRLPVKGNYIHNSAFKTSNGFKVVKKPGSPGGLTRTKVRPSNNYHQLQDGYTGIGTHPQAGLHDDRPPFKATFGDLKFNLPSKGLPDIPKSSIKESETKLLRDLPNVDQLDYEDSSNAASSSSDRPQYQFGKSYLKNPYGADFIRLEIDSNRYKHNKTRPRLGGIHHIPLKVHGYAETSEYPVSTDTERPVALKNPPKMKHLRPKKQINKAVKPPKPASPGGSAGADKNPLSFKALRESMETIPNAIHQIPDLMQSLVGNVWPSKSDDKEKEN